MEYFISVKYLPGVITVDTIESLEKMAKKLRTHSLISTTSAGSGHPTSCLSVAEIMSTLFFSELHEDDEFILSKGHAAPILWAANAEAGIIHEKELTKLRSIDSMLEGHPTPNMPFVKVATGSLGQGLSAGVGMALAKRLEKSSGRVYVLLGDGEMAEGSVWEAANSAAYYKLDNLTAIVDVNRLGQSEPTMHKHDVSAYVRKFEAFGWGAEAVDGHSVREILGALEKSRKSGGPFAILAKTLKGKGVSFLENMEGWHGRPLDQGLLKKALEEIGPANIRLESRIKNKENESEFHDFELDKYNTGEKVSTREAFGKALVKSGSANQKIVVVDADVKNSTMTEYFFRQFPERSFQSFIAEQNMVGMAIGLSAMGYAPFVSTFSTFFTRAYDFIRMAGYSRANIKFVGSHSGISIGQDGPSQMGLEDIPMFLNIPNSVVLYPSDAVSAQYLVREMTKHAGISYLRTTREKTPVIYSSKEEFPLGCLKVLRKSGSDQAMIVAAGITLHEALDAHDMLEKKGISIRVVDLYSLKPFDSQALKANARESGNNVIVVEDHYGIGLGSMISTVLDNVKYLCVNEMPRSGHPKDLMRRYEIDSHAIVKMVEQVCMK